MTQVSKIEPIILRVTHRYGASPERVFDAWLDPEKARQFFFATPDGVMVRVEIDARVGGKFNFTDRRDGQDAEHTGEYLEVDRPRRLVFMFSVGAEPTRVAIDIAPVDEGSELTLTHEMSPEWAEYEERTKSGWLMMLDGLQAVLAAGY